MRRSPSWRLGLLTVLLAACSASPEVKAPPPPTPPASPALASAQLAILIPAGPEAAPLTPQYVSSATQSVKVTIDGTAKTFAAGTGQPNCTGSGPVLCTFTLTDVAPPGAHTFTVTAYAGQDGTGSLLGTFGPESRTLDAGVTNSLNFTLTAVVNGVQVQPTQAASDDNVGVSTYLLSAGTPRNFRATQYDPANQVVSGPGTPALYACPASPDVQVSADDHLGNFTLTTANAKLTDAVVSLRRDACTGTVVTALHVANAVALTLDANAALPTDVTGPVKLQDGGGAALPDLTVRGSAALVPGAYTLTPQVINSGVNRYTPGGGSVSVTLRLGAPLTQTFTYTQAVHVTFKVTASTYAPRSGDPVTLTAQLLDASDQPLKKAGDVVTWSSSGTGSFSSPTSTTDASGQASVTYTPTGAAGSTQTVTATTSDYGVTVTGSSDTIGIQGPPTAAPDGPGATSAPGDPYHVAFNQTAPLTVAASSTTGLLANDNRGFPVGAIASFGGGDLGGNVADHAAGSSVTFGTGGSLKVNADGSFSFVPAQGFTGNFTFQYRLGNSVGTSDGTVTLAVGVRPAAVNDTYTPTVIGNVPVNTARAGGSGFSLLANDTGSGLRVTGADTTTTGGGGTVSVNPDGTFSFTPAAGFTGTTSFNYTVANGFGSKTASVNLTVAGRIWFVDSAAAPGGDGRQGAPFRDLASFAAVNDGAALHPADNDTVFLATGAGSYSGPLTLRGGQKLIGQSSSVSLGAASGLTVPADAALPATGGTPPTITSGGNGLNLASNNTLRGFNLGNAAGTALGGSGFGTLTVAEVGINTGGQALSLTNGTLSGSFSTLRSTGGANNVLLSNVNGTATLGAAGDALSGASGDAFKVSGGSGSFTYPGSISNASALAVNVSGKTGGTVTFSGALNPAGAARGVSLSNNTGATVNFSGPLKIATTNTIGFSATGGGTVTATGTGSTLGSTGATALNVSDTSIGAGGLNFQSISASGGTNGIVLNNTGGGGGLTVSGTGAAGSGGTIQNTVGADGTTGGIGISLNNTRNVSLNGMQLNDHPNFAIRGSGVSGFTLAGSTVSGTNGSNENAPYTEGSVYFTELTGAASFSNSSISGGRANNLRVTNTSGALDRLLLDNVTVGANSTAGGNSVLIEPQGSAVMKVTVQNSRLTAARDQLFMLNLTGSPTADLVFSNNTLSNNHPSIVSGGGGMTLTSGGAVGYSPRLTYSITNNTFRDALGTALLVSKLIDAGTFSGTISGNTIGVAGVANSGSQQGSGIQLISAVQGSNSATIQNNRIYQYNNYGVSLQAGGIAQSASGTTTHNAALNATITGNTISNPGNGGALIYGIYLNSGTTSNSPGGTPDAYQVCASISGNSLTGSGVGAGNDIVLRQRFMTTVRLPGYVGANNDTAAVMNFVQSNNGGASATAATSVATYPGAGGFVGGAPCSTP
ncbi:hypothetical protein E5F05_01265 (plasmid) [Deinococcus metallilatus]|uniref:Big-1 domain-containing protein n=1 Tax=Deinococcus metallilatus TaxID=1211322 RepID=A0ABR6MNL9_9DEIO|nr:cadherin-like domain-containing protein [Deinococcus metallilatus]MBB5293539.1 hypothetical protein [Deinococcus metallilatus]QBY06614.1 hypothetical protein E5F05_01265 [Deinococcus metallilatus]RXJ17957.1 hypothetical protein ERJ73_00875 [Deinococcus metallilatus]GMA15240.1 hypothetical protein GCM10025871_15710 [Deinococcus metallilatus]